MSTYPSNGVTRESISLDEDDLTDVEDEVFIRDGRNGFKFAEDRGVKRPLMAPRRKLGGKPDLASRLRNRPPCRVMCVPCCYAFAALSVFLGLIMLIIILVSLFPLPIDKLKTWISNKSSFDKNGKVFPCTDMNATEVWSYTLPKLSSESTMRAVDVNLDGVDDIIFGFGLGEDVFLPEQWFCPMFLGVSPPCQGGLIALDGKTGKPLWTKWLNHPVFTLFCSADLNGDKIFDCLASGKGGVLCAINGHNGTLIWEYTSNKTSPIIDFYAGSFVPDQDKDNITDIVASHTVQKGRNRIGFLTIISGKTGNEIVEVPTPNSAEIYYAPQIFTRFNGEKSIIYGTGGQNTPGALYVSNLKDIMSKNTNPYKIYEDSQKGILSPVVLVDVNGDRINDIISAMYNSTIIAFDGILFKQIWNYTIPDAESISIPTPGYFNTDNVTDFLVKYQIGRGFPIYYYSQTLIIDGKTGKPIYKKPFIDNGGEQLQGLTIRMENFGNDMFLYWMSYCKDFENAQNAYDFVPGSTIWQKTRSDLCKLRFNSTKVTKLFGMNQYNEPPGILLYSSDTHEDTEYNNSLSPLDTVKLYLKNNPDFNLFFKNPSPNIVKLENSNFNKQFNPYNRNGAKIQNQNSNFRHRDDGKTLIKDYMEGNAQNLKIIPQDNLNENPEIDKYDYAQPDLIWNPSPINEIAEPQVDYPYSDPYGLNTDQATIFTDQISENIPRDPRSRPENSNAYPENLTEDTSDLQKSTRKKNLSDELDSMTPVDYKNVKASRYRLLNDLNELPNEILRQTLERNKALRQSRDSKNGDKDVEKKEARTVEVPETLWDLESEKELEDRENGYYRGKRDADNIAKVRGIPKVSSTGILLKPLSASRSKNSIDLVFATYWLLPKRGAQILLEKDIDCIKSKMQNSASKDNYQSMDKTKLQEIFTKMCLEERGVLSRQNPNVPLQNSEDLQKSPYYNQISQLTLGQMTIYRLHLECKCEILLSGERCAQINDEQNWSSYLGKFGTGYFNQH